MPKRLFISFDFGLLIVYYNKMLNKIRAFLHEKIILNLINGKFQPLENALSFSSMIHGMIILSFPIFSGKGAFGEIGLFEHSLGLSLLVSGLSFLIATCVSHKKARSWGSLIQFMSWISLTVMISFSPVFTIITPLAYLTLTMVYGFIHVHISFSEGIYSGVNNGE